MPHLQKRDLIVVIVSYRTKAHLRRCLSSLRGKSPQTSYQVMVVDNASGDGTASLVKREFPQVLLREERENIGFARGCNRVLQLPPPRYILFLNPDALVERGAVDLMVSLLEEREEVGIVGGGLWGYDGRLQPTYRRFPTYGNLFFTKKNIIGSLLGRRPKPRERAREVDSVAGAFMLIRGELFHRLQGFDERFFMYVEDVDLCYRAQGMGMKIFYLPQARARHFWGASTRFCRKRMVIEHHRSLYRFFEKHHPHLLKNLLLGWILLLNLELALAGDFVREVFLTEGADRLAPSSKGG